MHNKMNETLKGLNISQMQCMYLWIDGWMDGWTDEGMNACLYADEGLLSEV